MILAPEEAIGYLQRTSTQWEVFRNHDEQARLWADGARYKIIEAGRRSGKTKLAKMDACLRFMAPPEGSAQDYTQVICAPTRDQVKRIYWSHLKDMLPAEFVDHVSETELSIHGTLGPRIFVVGMDKPQRIEGIDLDHAKVDEMQDLKAGVWSSNIQPALQTDGREGTAWVYGIPRFSPDFEMLRKFALDPENLDYSYHHWTSASVLGEEKLEQIKATTDEHTFAVEYLATRQAIGLQAYYAFEEENNAAERLFYNPRQDLLVCFDWNISPGVAVFLQIQEYKGDNPNVEGSVLAAIDEVHIPTNSNTRKVVMEVLKKIEGMNHKARFILDGDPAGGVKHTSSMDGSDWDIVRGAFYEKYDRSRVRLDARFPAPREKARVNAVNALFKNAAGRHRFLIDPLKCPHLVEDFKVVKVKEHSDGELDKLADPSHSHLSDAAGYLIHRRFPTYDRTLRVMAG